MKKQRRRKLMKIEKSYLVTMTISKVVDVTLENCTFENDHWSEDGVPQGRTFVDYDELEKRVEEAIENNDSIKEWKIEDGIDYEEL